MRYDNKTPYGKRLGKDGCYIHIYINHNQTKNIDRWNTIQEQINGLQDTITSMRADMEAEAGEIMQETKNFPDDAWGNEWGKKLNQVEHRLRVLQHKQKQLNLNEYIEVQSTEKVIEIPEIKYAQDIHKDRVSNDTPELTY